MTVRINANSCKNALGTVFLLATAFFVCSTFISMRSVFADPVAPVNTGVTSGRQSPRSTSRATANRTVSRSTVSRGTVSPTRTAVSRGTVASRTISSRSITPARPTGATRSVASRNRTTNQTGNRAVRARTSTVQSRVGATGNVMSSSRASVNTTYSYLNSTLNTGNYSNIIDSSTGLISADAYANCMDSYYACMDEICTARSAAKGRCSCAGRATNFLAAEEALERANEELIQLSGQLSLLIATKGKGDELAAAFSLTEAEQVMNCVSWRETYAKHKKGETTASGGSLMEQWYKEHPTYTAASSNELVTTYESMPYYCSKNNNNFGFDITQIDGSSSDILAQLKAWADAKDLAKEYVKDDNNLITTYNSSISYIVNNLKGITLENTENATLDALAKKWGYQLYEYAHNNVCGRVLDSCFNGIYEACGTPPTVKESDGKTTHTKCMNGATTSCPFNYNSYISVNMDKNSGKYGDVQLNERGSSSTANATSSAACFGYTTTTTSSGIRATASTSTNDPYYSLRGPVADARRSIMQKYLLDANSACDTYGDNLKNTAQNINYQKVAAQQALQQKRLEFRQQEDTTVLADAKAAIDNFNECISEIWDCYDQYDGEDDKWTTARIKSYCAQTAQVPHCYEPMICSPLQSQLTAVIDKPDDSKCTFSADYRENNCRNVVTISEILYGTSTSTPVDITSLWDSVTLSNINSAAVREGCLRKALNCPLNIADSGREEGFCLRNWHKGYKSADDAESCPENSTSGYGYSQISAPRTINGWVSNYCRCMNGYTVIYKDNKYQCDITCGDGEYRKADGVCGSCSADKHPVYQGVGYEPHDCASNTTSCTLPNASSATRTWNSTTSSWGECIVGTCNADYHKDEESNSCVSNTRACNSGELAATGETYATAGTISWDTATENWGTVCKITACQSPAYEANETGTACQCAAGHHYSAGACVPND